MRLAFRWGLFALQWLLLHQTGKEGQSKSSQQTLSGLQSFKELVLMELLFHYLSFSRASNSVSHGSNLDSHIPGNSKSVRMAGAQIQLALNGSITFISIHGTRKLGVGDCLFLTTMEVILQSSSGNSVRTMKSYFSGCHHIPHIYVNLLMLDALGL